MGSIVTAYIVMGSIVMGSIVMASIAMAYIGMAYRVMAYAVVACKAMACIAMARVVTGLYSHSISYSWPTSQSVSSPLLLSMVTSFPTNDSQSTLIFVACRAMGHAVGDADM